MYAHARYFFGRFWRSRLLCISSKRTMVLVKKGTDLYRYASPVIGLHVCNNSQKLEDVSISKLSYKPHPYQKELAVHTDQNAVTKNLKHDCYLHTGKSNTKDCYSVPPTEQQSCAIESQDPPMHTMKKMAQEYKYASTVFVKPDKLSTEKKCTTQQCHFTPVSQDFLKEKHLGLVRKDIHATSNQGVRLSNPRVKSEYKYRYSMPKEAPGSKSDGQNDLNWVRGRARFNVTHNTITGDRFNTDKRKIGKAHYHEEYSPWAVKREYRAHAAKVRNRTTSIPKGDPDKENQKLSSHHHSYQNLSTFNDLKFNTLAETSQKTYQTSFKYKSSENPSPDAYTTTTSTDYDYKKEGIPEIAGSAWTRGESSVFSGVNLDSTPHKIQSITRGTYVTPSINSYRQHVHHADMITQSSVQLGSPQFRPTSRVTTAGASFVPFSNQPSQHIVPSPKNQLMLTPYKDFAQSTANHEAFQPKAAKPVKGGEEARKTKHSFDFNCHWSLPSREPPSYSTTHQDYYSNPDSRAYN